MPITIARNVKYMVLTHRYVLLGIHQVKSIQALIIRAVDAGLVTTAKPINITEWNTVNYSNIPQQKDRYVLAS